MGCINSSNKHLYAFKRDNVFNVRVVRVQTEQTVVLAVRGFLEITPHQLIFLGSEQEPVSWALQHLRRYGLTGNIFSFEAGRRCITGPGIYTFQCCNAAQFYAKFQRYINSMSVSGDRTSGSTNPSYIFGRLDSYQQNANHYLEPTSVQLAASLDERSILPESHSYDSNVLNHNSPDSIRSMSITAEIIHFPTTGPPYSNVSPNPNSYNSGGNIYMEQPIRVCSEHNNKSVQRIINKPNTNFNLTAFKPLLKSSSLDMPPDECAPILTFSTIETQGLYSNAYTMPAKTSNITSQHCYSKTADRCYANTEVFSRLDPLQIVQNKFIEQDTEMDQHTHDGINAPVVNYIILDLDQPRSPFQYSHKNGFDNCHSLSQSDYNSKYLKRSDSIPAATSISCGSSTVSKDSTMHSKDKKSPNMESSGSYTRIDFLKTFALMKSSTNCSDFDVENDNDESRITRHSKFVRKAYSISE